MCGLHSSDIGRIVGGYRRDIPGRGRDQRDPASPNRWTKKDEKIRPGLGYVISRTRIFNHLFFSLRRLTVHGVEERAAVADQGYLLQASVHAENIFREVIIIIIIILFGNDQLYAWRVSVVAPGLLVLL